MDVSKRATGHPHEQVALALTRALTVDPQLFSPGSEFDVVRWIYDQNGNQGWREIDGKSR